MIGSRDVGDRYVGKSALPYLLSQLRFTGHTILSVTLENGTPSYIDIEFCTDDEPITKHLFFVSTTLEEIGSHGSVFKRLIGEETFGLIVRDAPGFLESHRERLEESESSQCPLSTPFEQDEIESSIRVIGTMDSLLKSARIVVQDEHGIPFYWFNSNTRSPLQSYNSPMYWDSYLFGNTKVPRRASKLFYDQTLLTLEPASFFLSSSQERTLCSQLSKSPIPGF